MLASLAQCLRNETFFKLLNNVFFPTQSHQLTILEKRVELKKNTKKTRMRLGCLAGKAVCSLRRAWPDKSRLSLVKNLTVGQHSWDILCMHMSRSKRLEA